MKKLDDKVLELDSFNRRVLTEFVKHPNRALAVPEVAILLGGTALNNEPGFSIFDAFQRLEKEGKIRKTRERHVGPTVGDEVTTNPRYRIAS